ncbi:MAG: PhoH family protein [Phycisphaerales bacterium]|nr:MAG: PhoH family protein [Phycisphaerales bacterium]
MAESRANGVSTEADHNALDAARRGSSAGPSARRPAPRSARPGARRRADADEPTSGVGAEPEPDAADATSQGVKHFVLDTNVLLHNPEALFVFEENNVIVPFAVLEELDKFKGQNDDLGRNARQCIRHLDALREAGRLIEGVAWGEVRPTAGPSGVVRIDAGQHDRPDALFSDSPDNRIIAVAYSLHERGFRAVFVSKDINARIKADALGVRSEDFENSKVDGDRLYTGYLVLDAPGDLIDELYKDRMLPLERLRTEAEPADEGARADLDNLHANQFVVMRDLADESHTGLARRLADTDHVIPVTGPRKPVFGIMARNLQQTMALDMLLDDDIKLITMLGSAGTGKTLLALAAGMAKVFQEERYDRLLVARPIMPLGRDIGYLPGDKDEKLTAWMQPIFDNLEYLLSTRGSHMQTPESHSPEQRVRKLIADGKLVLEPLTYIRGRSIAHQFMIVDEAQNLTPHEVKTIVSRVGEGTRVVLTGDVGQIDNPYLDSSSNGLSYAIERMKGEGIVAHMTLAKSERSVLASLATQRL